jgi:hypothetical protein
MILAVENGYRESIESWGAILPDLKRRGEAEARDRRPQGAPPRSLRACWGNCGLAADLVGRADLWRLAARDSGAGWVF